MDRSALWRRLYAGRQRIDHFKASFERLPSPEDPRPMNTQETSCPRVVDLGGTQRLLVSHRYGRVFVYDRIPHGRL